MVGPEKDGFSGPLSLAATYKKKVYWSNILGKLSTCIEATLNISLHIKHWKLPVFPPHSYHESSAKWRSNESNSWVGSFISLYKSLFLGEARNPRCSVRVLGKELLLLLRNHGRQWKTGQPLPLLIAVFFPMELTTHNHFSLGHWKKSKPIKNPLHVQILR